MLGGSALDILPYVRSPLDNIYRQIGVLRTIGLSIRFCSVCIYKYSYPSQCVVIFCRCVVYLTHFWLLRAHCKCVALKALGTIYVCSVCSIGFSLSSIARSQLKYLVRCALMYLLVITLGSRDVIASGLLQMWSSGWTIAYRHSLVRKWRGSLAHILCASCIYSRFSLGLRACVYYDHMCYPNSVPVELMLWYIQSWLRSVRISLILCLYVLPIYR